MQNKILEAMSMARPVVASASCAEAIAAKPGAEFIVAATADEFVREIDVLLRNPDHAEMLGQAARQCVLRNYSWDANLARLDRVLTTIPNVGLAA